MKLDALVLKRLDELLTKGERILATREQAYTSQDDKAVFRIASPEVAGWGTSALSLIQRAFGESSTHFKEFEKRFSKYDSFESSFKKLIAILVAAKEDYEGGYLFNVKSLVKAEVLDNAIEQAQELLDSGYKDPACVVIGISLEITLKEIATRQGITLAKLDKINTDLYKVGTYNISKQKQITAWADLRNKAAHGEWAAYDEADVRDMLSGVKRFIEDYL